MTTTSAAGNSDSDSVSAAGAGAGIKGANAPSKSDAESVKVAADSQSAAAVDQQASKVTGNQLTDGFDSVDAFGGVTETKAEEDLRGYVAGLDATPKAPEPTFLEKAGAYVADTAKGYVTGAANLVLDAANLTNMGANALLSATPTDFRFKTDMQIAPTSAAEAASQNAVEVASVVAGGWGLLRGAVPKMAGGIQEGLGLGRPAAVAGGEATVAANGLRTWQAAEISAADAARIQATADRVGAPIHVVGSRAAGKTTGDWDFVVEGNKSAARNAARTLPRGFVGGEQTPMGWSGRDVFQTMSPNAGGYTQLNTALPHVTFTPRL